MIRVGLLEEVFTVWVKSCISLTQVRTVFEELRDARSPLVADLGAFTGEALRQGKLQGRAASFSISSLLLAQEVRLTTRILMPAYIIWLGSNSPEHTTDGRVLQVIVYHELVVD